MDLTVWGVKEEQVKEFRDWLNEQEHLPDVPDEYLARFLHSCYFNMETAKKSFEAYIKLKTKAPELFSNRNLEGQIMTITMENSCLGILPTTTSNGYSVIWGRLKSPDVSKFFIADCLKLLYMTIDRLLLERKGCPGIIFVYDTETYNFRHLLRTHISAVRNYFEYMQEAAPMRLKTVHFINAGSVITHIMRMIQPFVYKEHLQKIHFHSGSIIEGLLDEITIEQIPVDYGGSGPCLANIQDENLKRLSSLANWFKFDEKLKLIEVKKKRTNILGLW